MRWTLACLVVLVGCGESGTDPLESASGYYAAVNRDDLGLYLDDRSDGADAFFFTQREGTTWFRWPGQYVERGDSLLLTYDQAVDNHVGVWLDRPETLLFDMGDGRRLILHRTADSAPDGT